MTEKFQNKYRIESARAQWWDYGWNGAYFITICTQNREHFFGEITNGKMKLSRLGVIADILWHEIPNHAPFAELGEFVVMPNHIHGILILNKPNEMDDGMNDGGAVQTLHAGMVQTLHAGMLQTLHAGMLQTLHATSPQSPQSQSPQSKSESPQSPQSKSESPQSPQSESQSPQSPQSQSESPQQSQSPPPKTNIKNEKMAEISPKSNSVSTIIRSYKSAVTKHANRLGLKNG